MVFALQAAPLPEADITVIGRRLKEWQGTLQTHKGDTACTTKRSTGDAEIDAIGCAAMLACWPAAQPRIAASQAKGIAKSERARIIAAVNGTMTGCLNTQYDVRTAALADRRAAARGATQ